LRNKAIEIQMFSHLAVKSEPLGYLFKPSHTHPFPQSRIGDKFDQSAAQVKAVAPRHQKAGDMFSDDLRDSANASGYNGLAECHSFPNHPSEGLVPPGGLTNDIARTEDPIEKRVSRLTRKSEMGFHTRAGNRRF
jgi:hypothetical protein